MTDQLNFNVLNRERMQAVVSTFGRSKKLLLKPDRILVGEGCLMKLCRRGPKLKVFFLFNDILVYGSIMVPGRWNSKKKIISLEEVEQEDLEDGMAMANQWLIRTPRKSFYVSAATPEEKNEWMEHIERYRALHMQTLGHTVDNGSKNFAATWIPDMASAICMRCSGRFNVAKRRHHCRKCGYIVCNTCSESRALLPNISSKPVRVCRNCKSCMQDGQEQGQKKGTWKPWKKNSMEDTATQPEYETSSDEDLENQNGCQVVPTRFKGPEDRDFSPYCYIKAEHMTPPVTTFCTDTRNYS